MIGELAALGAALSWAIAPILYRKALLNTKPVSANIVRLSINAVVLVAALLVLGKVGVLASLPPSVLLIVVASGIVGLGVGDMLYLFGLKSLGVSRAVPLAATYPLFCLIWAVVFLGQPLSLTAVLGTGVILVGIVLLTRQKAQEIGVTKGQVAWVGAAFCLGTAFAWSIGITLMDVAVSTAGLTSLDANYAMVTLRIAAIALVLLPLAPFIDRDHGFLKMSKKTMLLICVGGLVANGLGWLLLNYSFLNIAEAQAVPISSASPLFAALAGFVFFHEKATAKIVLGAVAIVAGIILIFMV